MIFCGGALGYFAIKNNAFSSDLIFIGKFFIGLIILFSTGILFYLLYKFRLLVIYNKSIISIYPFLLKKEKIDLNSLEKHKYENFIGFNVTTYRRVILTDPNTNISFTDMEFENFETLTNGILNSKNKRNKVDLKQAASNISNMNFNVYLLSGMFIFMIWIVIWNSRFHPVILTFFGCNGILLYSCIKRKLKYKKIIKTVHNNV